MTTQALSVAISSNGLTEIFNALVVSGRAFATALEGQSLGSPDVYIGYIGATNLSDYSVQLTNGTIQTASGTLTSATQAAPGSPDFQLAFDINLTGSFQDWTEQGEETNTGFHGGPPITTPFGPFSCGPWSFTANGITLNATVQILQTNGLWGISFVSATSNTPSSGISFSIPVDSILSSPPYNNSGDCGYETIAQQLDPYLASSINYAPAIQAAIGPILNDLIESGKLTSSITFQWTPNTVEFPTSASGLQTGVTGGVLYDSTPFSYGATPPDLPLPTIVETSDVRFFAADSLFSALFWAYTEANALSLTIIPGDLAEPALLNTSYYKTSIPDLYNEYPNAPMQVVVTPQSAPTIAFIAGYELPPPYVITPVVLASLQSQGLPANDIAALQPLVDIPYSELSAFQTALTTALGADYATYGQTVITAATTGMAGLASQLPSAVYTPLLDMVDETFNSQAAFQAALANQIGAANAAQYQTQIEAVAATVLAQFTHAPTCTYQVMWQGNPVTVFVIQVQEVDELTNFQLGVKGTGQTIQSDYQIAGLPTATLVSSTLPDVNASDFNGLWQFALAPAYGTTLQEVAATGVPVPWIEGYTLQQSTVILQPGYADVTANVVFPSS